MPGRVGKMSGTNLRARLAEIYQQMSALEEQMAMLRSEQEAVQRDLAAIVYPVLTLPNDVVSEIFLHYVKDHPRCSPLCLIWVCRSWRAVAFSTCRLWTRLWRFKMNHHLVDAVTLSLAHSGSLPLELVASLVPASWQDPSVLFRLVSQNASRFRIISFALDTHSSSIALAGPFTRLEVLGLLSSGGELTPIPQLDAPNLRKVTLKCPSLGAWKATLPWAQLTTLTLVSDLYSCWEILSCTSNLEVLTMHAKKRGSRLIPASSYLTLSHLHTIHLEKRGKGCTSKILSYLTLPALNDSTFWPTTASVVDRFTRLLGRSQCPLRTVTLMLHETESHVLDTLLEEEALRSVQSLTLLGLNGDYGALNNLFNLLSNHKNLPALEHLCIEDCAAYAGLSPLVDFLHARVDCDDGETRLKSFKLSFSNKGKGNEEREIPYQPDIDNAFSRLEALRRRFAGLEFDVRSEIPWLHNHIDSPMIQKIQSFTCDS